MDRHKLLGESSIPRLLLNFSIPAITGMLVNGLYNVVDRIFIGQGVGALAIAGATISFPVMIIGLAFAMLFGLGATAAISIALGEQRKEYAEKILGNNLMLLLIASVLLTSLGLIFIDPILRIFGASDTVFGYAHDYLFIIVLGFPFMLVGFGMNHMIRGEGNPKMSMSTMLIGAILNTILDPLFIYVFHMGVQGAAIATIISQAVSAAWVMLYFIHGKSHLKLHLKNLKLERDIVLRIVTVGSAPFAMQLAASVMNGILNFQLQSFGGDLAISALGIVSSLQTVLLMPLFGLNQGAQPIIGFNYGARKFDRVRKTVLLAASAATGYVILGFIVVQLFPAFFIRLFNSDDEGLLALTVHALQTFFLFLPVIGFQIVSASYFQAVGKPIYSMVLSLSRQVLLIIPLLFILPPFFGLNGVWATIPASDLISSILTGILLFFELQHLDNAHAQVKRQGIPIVLDTD